MSREKPRQVDDKPGRAGAGAPPEPEEPPARASAYIPPMAVPKESRYHTIDMKAVRLSPDIDPQRMKTQLSLRAVQAVTEKRPSRLPAWIALLLVGGALGTCLWWFSRWRTVQGSAALVAPAAAGVVAPAAAVSPSLPIAVTQPTFAEASVPSGSAAPSRDGAGSEGAGLPVPPPESSARATAIREPTAPRGVSAIRESTAIRDTTSSRESTASRVPASARAQSKPVATKVSPAPRKVSAPAAHPASEGAQPTSTQPKLWLE
jgi:hypothetical protein